MSDSLRAEMMNAPPFLITELLLKTLSRPHQGAAITSTSRVGNTSLPTSLPNTSSPQTPAQALPAHQTNPSPPLDTRNAHMVAQGANKSISITRYLSLCVTASSHQFVSIRCDVLSLDLEFYSKMKDEYNRVRGWLRLFFSMWQYDHCEFVRFKKYGYHRGARLRVAFPE